MGCKLNEKHTRVRRKDDGSARAAPGVHQVNIEYCVLAY
jgi:hypothetical protein